MKDSASQKPGGEVTSTTAVDGLIPSEQTWKRRAGLYASTTDLKGEPVGGRHQDGDTQICRQRAVVEVINKWVRDHHSQEGVQEKDHLLACEGVGNRM